jgi:hypothetical protein
VRGEGKQLINQLSNFISKLSDQNRTGISGKPTENGHITPFWRRFYNFRGVTISPVKCPSLKQPAET